MHMIMVPSRAHNNFAKVCHYYVGITINMIHVDYSGRLRTGNRPQHIIPVILFSNSQKILVQDYATMLFIAINLLARHACHLPVARARKVIWAACGLFVWTLNLDWACSAPH